MGNLFSTESIRETDMVHQPRAEFSFSMHELIVQKNSSEAGNGSHHET